MAKVWKAGDRIPLEHINELEKIAEKYAAIPARPEKPEKDKGQGSERSAEA